VVGRLNFWITRATLTVQVLDLRPSLTAVLRQFERVHALLEPEGLFEAARKRSLPRFPTRIALLTSVPSSALADMLRTAQERWPATALLVVPIPVQGAVEATIREALDRLAHRSSVLGLEALVLARGGGSREDLSVFDGELLARALAACPIPVVCGLGHEDDTTVADLVADHRAATPTAAVVALLPDRQAVQQGLTQARRHLEELLRLRLLSQREGLRRQGQQLQLLHPAARLAQHRSWLEQQRRLLEALSPQHLLQRGFALVRDGAGAVLRSVHGIEPGAQVQIALADGAIEARVEAVNPAAVPATGGESSPGNLTRSPSGRLARAAPRPGP
jgi:exodeoxyribonuclease VII large subunit